MKNSDITSTFTSGANLSPFPVEKAKGIKVIDQTLHNYISKSNDAGVYH